MYTIDPSGLSVLRGLVKCLIHLGSLSTQGWLREGSQRCWLSAENYRGYIVRADLPVSYLGTSYFQHRNKNRRVSALMTMKTSQRPP